MEYPYKITLIKELLLRNLSPQVLLDSYCQYNQKETDAVVLWGMLGAGFWGYALKIFKPKK